MHKDFQAIEDYEIVVKYGKKISLKNESDVLAEIKDAKLAGMNFSFIQSLQMDLIYARYKNNQSELERHLLLNDIEPFAGYTVDEILKFKEYVSDEDLRLKVNFESLIDQYEAKTPIQFDDIGVNYKDKIVKIKEELYSLLPEKKEQTELGVIDPSGF